MRPRRGFMLGWVLAYTAGRAALQRALPVYLGIVMGALILFGRNGLHPRTVVSEASHSSAFRLALYAAWILATVPAIRALLGTETTFFLRTLPVRRRDMLAVQAAMIVIVELPWTVLWAKGGDATLGIAATALAVAASGLILTGLRRVTHVVMLGSLVAVLWAMPRHPIALAAVALPSAVFAVWFVWRRAPEVPRTRSRAWVRGPAWIALTLGYLAVWQRRSAAQIVRAFGFVALAGGIGFLTIQNQVDRSSWSDVESVALMTAVPGLAFGVAGLMGPLFRTEGQLAWLLAVCGTSRWTGRLASLLATWALALLLSAGHALLMGFALQASESQAAFLVLHDVAIGLVVAVSVHAVARWALRNSGHDAIRLIAGVGLLTGAICISLHSFRAYASIGWALLAMLSLPWRSPRSRSRNEPRRVVPIGGETMLEVIDVTKRLRGRNVLDGVNLRCQPGEIGVVLGENGAGKSTLLRVVSGMIEPDAGQVSIRGHLLAGGGLEARRELGYLPDATESLPDLLVAEFIHLVRALKQVPADRKADDDLRGWREKLGLDGVWSQRFSSLSFGQRKRACLVAALAGDPWLLLLDEPSNGLDPEGVALMSRLLVERQASGKAALLASNDLPFVNALLSKHYRLKDGKLSSMTPRSAPSAPGDEPAAGRSQRGNDQRGAHSS